MGAKSCCPPARRASDLPPLTGPAGERELARLAKVLGHPARVRIVRFLREHESCVCGTIVDEVGLAQSTVSQHLKVLKAAGFVRGTVSGPSMCSCLEPAVLQRFERLFRGLAR
ncbi:MAG: winged helix-turn-helix transcriptional regulator [Planctomycetes bacterium]|nr:winged helix-turn-helix transcriptional regulator [Planctomycetota bacterium]